MNRNQIEDADVITILVPETRMVEKAVRLVGWLKDRPYVHHVDKGKAEYIDLDRVTGIVTRKDRK